MEGIDEIRFHFGDSAIWVLNLSLAFIMFGVALSLQCADFRRILRSPKPALTGLFSQFLLLPALTFVLVILFKPGPSFGLGLMLVGCCPGGNVSNFMSQWARADTALSVSLTAAASVLALVLTPFNFSFWGSMIPGGRELMTAIDLDTWDIIRSVFLILIIPLFCGMWFASRFPDLADRLMRPARIFSLTFFLVFVAAAFAANSLIFMEWIGKIFILVLVHNSLAYLMGYAVARGVGLKESSRRSISIESGIQNAGLALVLVFSHFEGLGGMTLVAGWWGIWHLVSGMSLATIWSGR